MSDGVVDGLGLKESIEAIRGELLSAQAASVEQGFRFPISSVTVELKVVATTGIEGKAGFRVPLVSFELGTGASHEWQNTHTVTVVLGSPIDNSGQEVWVSRGSSVLPG